MDRERTAKPVSTEDRYHISDSRRAESAKIRFSLRKKIAHRVKKISLQFAGSDCIPEIETRRVIFKNKRCSTVKLSSRSAI